MSRQSKFRQQIDALNTALRAPMSDEEIEFRFKQLPETSVNRFDTFTGRIARHTHYNMQDLADIATGDLNAWLRERTDGPEDWG